MHRTLHTTLLNFHIIDLNSDFSFNICLIYDKCSQNVLYCLPDEISSIFFFMFLCNFGKMIFLK